MFIMTALVCGLQQWPDRDEEGCFLFKHQAEFEVIEECEKTLRVTGLGGLGMFLAQRGELEAELIEFGCIPIETETNY